MGTRSISASGRTLWSAPPAPSMGNAPGRLELHIASAETVGTAEALTATLGAVLHRMADGTDKERHVRELGADEVAAVGNGRNEAAMLRGPASRSP